ncbi:MAG TPA: ribosome recycling factor [Amoebophilaceae bacterium]|jgi:ribosome recycling factor|nr:ribosome recycling factor [Amoebophilaceae bacterium]
METNQQCLEEAEHAMAKVYSQTQDAFAKIQAGRAVPAMLQQVLVAHYGTPTPLHQLAAINTMDARTLTIQPWEQQLVPHIEKAIAERQLGFSTKNDGRMVVATLPPPSEERRKNLVKLIKTEAEKYKVIIRNVRRDYKEGLKLAQKSGTPEEEIKRAEKKLQERTDAYIHKINELLALKEADVMTV